MTQFKFTFRRPNPNSRARLGILETPHGTVETPAFIFCATKAAIKGVTPEQMKAEGTQFILSNTYHLMLQPGSEVVQKAGGLHKFMGWNGPMLTDSGGFQIFSLGHGSVAEEIKGRRNSSRPKTMLKITEEGAKFKSYINGQTYMLTPEKSVQVQRELGPDFVVVLDECTPYHVDKRYTARSMHMSHRWAVRSMQEFNRHDDGSQKLYGILQGGVYEDLRKEACDFVNSHNFFGHAVGGSLGASKDQMYDVVAMTMENLRDDRPVHLLGIGGVQDIFNGVRHGIDTFDCVHPTRLARHGGALVRPENNPKPTREHIVLSNSQYREDYTPIEPDCACNTCQNYSKAYIHHLMKAGELLAYPLITVHNVNFMNRLLAAVRHGIETGTLDQIEKDWVPVKKSF
ncbi:MAG: tRNA guanosine(34) transglycosylase Tgt [Candidatus Paracaedibacteraceae bacterium]|nr:tRNA guanosine(34) transglycosylase Tgt [Candidatus Paracaedibacteraceae bacterium]